MSQAAAAWSISRASLCPPNCRSLGRTGIHSPMWSIGVNPDSAQNSTEGTDVGPVMGGRGDQVGADTDPARPPRLGLAQYDEHYLDMSIGKIAAAAHGPAPRDLFANQPRNMSRSPPAAFD